MSEEFKMDNDYTLSILQSASEKLNSYSSSYAAIQTSSLTKTFNFQSAQVTTIVRDSLFESHGSESGGSAAISTQMIIQNFSDIDSKEEIKLMHEKLVELGGHPPELSGTLKKTPPASVNLTR